MVFRINFCNNCFSFILIGHIILWIYICFGTTIIKQSRSHYHVRARDVFNTKTLRPANFKNEKLEIASARDKNLMNGQPALRPGLSIDIRSRGEETPRNNLNKGLQSRQLRPMVAGKDNFHELDQSRLLPEQQSADTEDVKQYYNAQLGHTILPRDASAVLDGIFLKNPKDLCSQHTDLDLVVLVHTAPYHFQRRKRLRRVFMDPNTVDPYTVQLVFMIGKTINDKINEEEEQTLEAENNKYGDFVQMDFVENFRNLSLKATMWLRWTNEFCPNAMMVLKIDDDVILDVRRVLPLSRGLFSKYKRSIFCNLNKLGFQPIPRIGRTKVDPREFADNKYYPYNYCSGFVVFLSRDLVQVLAKTIRKTPFYNVDDVFMFGMVPKVAGNVVYHNIGFNVSIWHKKVFNCIVEKGIQCQYFATMAEDLKDLDQVCKAIDQAHIRDFHYPKLKVL